MQQTRTFIQETVDINEQQMLDLIKTAIPDLYSIVDLLRRYDVPTDVVTDFLHTLHRVREQGWGSVVVTVKDSKIATLEGKNTVIYAVERHGKNV